MYRDLKNLEPVMHLFKHRDEYRIWLGDQGDTELPYVTFYMEKNDEKHVVGCGQIEYDKNETGNLVAAIEDSFLDFYGIHLEENELTRISDFLLSYAMKYQLVENFDALEEAGVTKGLQC